MARKQGRRRTADGKTSHESKRTNASERLDHLSFRTPLLGAVSAARTPETIDAAAAARYLEQYVKLYRQQHSRLVAPPPGGRGYPDLRISPFLYSKRLTCAIASDGYALWDGWDQRTADGPLKLRPPDDREEPEILALTGTSPPLIMVENAEAPEHFRLGLPRDLLYPKQVACIDNTAIDVYRYAVSFDDLVSIICFGCDFILQMIRKQYVTEKTNFWAPTVINEVAFGSAGARITRYFHYFEASRHAELASWDTRSIWVRVGADVTRDFQKAVAALPGWGSVSLTAAVVSIVDRLSTLADAIYAFKNLLETDQDSEEKVFHDFLYAHPVLIDVYGRVVSKPRWRFPEGMASAVGKTYLEPDFVVCYHGQRYKLVEIEKPSKRLATEKGHPRSELGQAANQFGEWKTYLKYHADLIRDDFPNIGMDSPGMLVISRSSVESVGRGRDADAVKEMYAMGYAAEIYTYDDLLARAQVMYDRLSAFSTEPAVS